VRGGRQSPRDSAPPSTADQSVGRTLSEASLPSSKATPEAPGFASEPKATSSLFMSANLTTDAGSTEQSWGLAWQPLDGDASPRASEVATPSAADTAAEPPVVSEAAEVKRPDEATVRPRDQNAERVGKPTTPAWAAMSPDMLPRVASPRRFVDIRARPGRSASPPKWQGTANGTTGASAAKVSAGSTGVARGPRSSAGQTGRSSPGAV
jgi:hypothetical protein